MAGEEIKLIELKAYRLLAKIRGSMLSSIRHKAMNKVEYKSDKPEESFELVSWIANPGKWEYCGILRNEEKAVLEVLEYLLNDEATGIHKYTDWEPPKR